MIRLKFKKFSSEANKSKVSDNCLNETFNDFLKLDMAGKQKYSLGGSLYKLRISSKSGRGKSGGSRSILALNINERLIWLHMFDKNDKGNISNKELKKLKFLADILLKLTNEELNQLIDAGELLEVSEHDKS